MNYSQLTIVLTEPEMAALRKVAQRNVRRPRDQARYLILNSLGLTNNEQADSMKYRHDAKVSSGHSVIAVEA